MIKRSAGLLSVCMTALVLALAIPSAASADTPSVPILEGRTIAGVRLGLHKAQVDSILGSVVYVDGVYDVYYALPAGTVSVLYASDRAVEVIAKPMTWSAGVFLTSRGIETGGEPPFPFPGSTPEEIESAYPGIAITIDDPNAGRNEISLQYRLARAHSAVTYFTFREICFGGYNCDVLSTALQISLARS